MAENINIMEAIYQMADKEEDGSLHYVPEFIDFLWENSFADTKQFSLETWRQAFDPFKQQDGTYRLNREEFLSLDKYRYTGEVKIPFDATRINEGKYTDEGFQKLVDLSIEPSCSLPPNELKTFLDNLKNEFRQADDLVLIRADAKQRIKKLLEEHPSPLRRLELSFDELIGSQETDKKAEELRQKTSTVATKEQLAAMQQSQFIEGAASAAEAQSKRLKQVAKAKEKEAFPAGEGAPLKTIKRSKKGLRG